MREVDMGKVEPKVHRDAGDFRELPEPVRLEDTTTTQESREAPSPTMARDAETEWLLRNAAG